MDYKYLFTNAIIDTTIFVSAILVLFFAFQYLAKTVTANSFVGRSKKWAKRITVFSIISIVLFQLLFVWVPFGFVTNKIILVSTIILPVVILFFLSLLALTHLSARGRIVDLLKSRYTLGVFTLISAALSFVIFIFSHLVKLAMSNLNGVDTKEIADHFDPGKPKSREEDQSRFDSDISASGHYDLVTGKYKKGHEWMDID
jgi:hypothetical protein